MADDVRGERELKLAAQRHLDDAIAAGEADDAMRWATVIDAFRYAGEDDPAIKVIDLPRPSEFRRLDELLSELHHLASRGWRLSRAHPGQAAGEPMSYEHRPLPEIPTVVSPSLGRVADLVEIRTMAPLDSAQRRALHQWVDLAVADARSEDDALDLERRLRHLIDET